MVSDALRTRTKADVHRVVIWSLLFCLLTVANASLIRRWVPDISKAHVFFHQFVAHDLPGSVLSGILLLAALALYRRNLPVRPLLASLDTHRYPVAAVVAALLAVGTLTVYHNHPLSVDEFAQLFQARIFAKGRIWTTYPPALLDALLPFSKFGFFRVGSAGGQVVTDYWPGFSLLQAPFVLVGTPWLLNPLLAGGSLLLVRHLAARLYPETDAPAWAMLFTLASPAFVVNAISYYSLPAVLFLNLAFTALILKGTSKALVAAGILGSLALVQKNPMPHALYAAPWIVWLLARRGGRRAFLRLALGYLPLTLLLGAGWALLRLSLGAQDPAGGDTAYGAPWRILSVLSLRDFILTLYFRSLGLLKLAMWAAPGLLVLAVLGAKRRWQDGRIRLLAASMVLSFAGYCLFRVTQGHGWGYRHLQGAWAVLPLLACGALAARKERSIEGSLSLARFAAVSAVLSLVFFNGLRFFQVDAWMDRHLAQLPPLDPDRKQVCFIRPSEGYYSIDLVQNDPFLRGSTIFLKSKGPETEKTFMQEHFPAARQRSGDPNETVWLMDGCGG